MVSANLDLQGSETQTSGTFGEEQKIAILLPLFFAKSQQEIIEIATRSDAFLSV